MLARTTGATFSTRGAGLCGRLGRPDDLTQAETGWPLERRLGHPTRDRVGLAADVCRGPGTGAPVFTARVFGKKEL